MAKFVLVVQSKAQPGRDDDYNAWYDDHHFGEICALPGVTGGRRLDYVMSLMGDPGLPYLALYEVETDDIGATMAEMGKRGASGEMTMSDALDGPASVFWVYKINDKYV